MIHNLLFEATLYQMGIYGDDKSSKATACRGIGRMLNKKGFGVPNIFFSSLLAKNVSKPFLRFPSILHSELSPELLRPKIQCVPKMRK